MSRRSIGLTWLSLSWPREVSADDLTAALRLLAASAGSPVILQATGSATGVEHRVAVLSSRAAVITRQLQAAVPGLGVRGDDARHQPGWNRAVKLSLTTGRRALRTEEPELLARALLTALTHVGAHEHLMLQWLLGPGLTPMVVPSSLPGQHPESWAAALLLAPWRAPAPPDSEARGALRTKQGEAGWRALGRIAVRAALVARQRQLLGQVVGALRLPRPGCLVAGPSRETRPGHSYGPALALAGVTQPA